MNNTASVAVLSRSFSAHEKLTAELNRRYSDVTLNDTGRTLAGDELVAFLQGKSHVVVALEKITDDILARLPDLKVIGKYGVGLNNVDLHACEAHGVHVGWTGGVNRRSVAELVIALSIASLRHVVRSHMETGGVNFVRSRVVSCKAAKWACWGADMLVRKWRGSCWRLAAKSRRMIFATCRNSVRKLA